jgi:hypothetical protein
LCRSVTTTSRKEKEICSKANEDAALNEANQMQTIFKARSKEFHARQFVKSIETLYTCSKLGTISTNLNTITRFSPFHFQLPFMLHAVPNNTNIDLTTTINNLLL